MIWAWAGMGFGMSVFVRVGHGLAEAFWTNWKFLTKSYDDLPESRGLLATELRSLVERDLAVLVHKRSKWNDDDAPGKARWFADLEAFVSRSLRPRLAGESLLALWNDGALMRSLDALVANEQKLVPIRVENQLPVTCRFDSHWA